MAQTPSENRPYVRMSRRNDRHPMIVLSTAIHMEQVGGASHLPDVEADLRYAARLLREQVGQCSKVIEATQDHVIETARDRGVLTASGAVERRAGWAVPR